MKNYFLLLVGLTALALGSAAPAQAEEPAINFDLSPDSSLDQATIAPDTLLNTGQVGILDGEESNRLDQALQVPSDAAQAPVQSGEAIADLPPPPTVAPIPAPTTLPAPVATEPIPIPAPVVPLSEPPPDWVVPQIGSDPVVAQPTWVDSPIPEAPNDLPPTESLALSFDLPPVQSNPALTEGTLISPDSGTPAETSLPSYELTPGMDEMFQRGSDSLVATAVGSAEGTRTPEGDRTSAYYGHSDPGNGVWNLGTFSYQHGAKSPEEADLKQLQRLHGQFIELQQEAIAKGVQLSLEEKLNGIDLANQSPRAALSRGGYIDRLKEAREAGLMGSDAILWARVRSYLDPDTQQWNAPGLGNTVEGISRDQERRMEQIARAIAAYGDRHTLPTDPAQTDPNPSEPKADQDDGGITNLLIQPMKALFSPPPRIDTISTSSAEIHESAIDQLLGFDLSNRF